MDIEPAHRNAEQWPPLHPAYTFVTAIVLGVAALVAPAWLAHANPTGLEVVDGVVVHEADAPGAKLRAGSYVGGMLAVAGVKPGSDRTRRFVVGLHFVCVEEGHEAELRAVRAVPREGTPEIPSSGVVRRLAANSVAPDAMRLAVGTAWGDPTKAADDLGTWHDLAGAEVTGICASGDFYDFDAFEAGGEEVVAVLEVGQEGIDVERFELETLVDGRPHRLLIDADVAVCGTQVRGDISDDEPGVTTHECDVFDRDRAGRSG